MQFFLTGLALSTLPTPHGVRAQRQPDGEKLVAGAGYGCRQLS